MDDPFQRCKLLKTVATADRSLIFSFVDYSRRDKRALPHPLVITNIVVSEQRQGQQCSAGRRCSPPPSKCERNSTDWHHKRVVWVTKVSDWKVWKWKCTCSTCAEGLLSCALRWVIFAIYFFISAPRAFSVVITPSNHKSGIKKNKKVFALARSTWNFENAMGGQKIKRWKS